MMRLIALILMSTVALTAQQPVAKTSATCGPLRGNTVEAVRRLEWVCDHGVAGKGLVDSADAYDSVLTFQVTRAAANTMRGDPLTGKQLVLMWMKLWRVAAGGKQHAVSISVKWMDVEVAKGETHVLSDDTVEIK